MSPSAGYSTVAARRDTSCQRTGQQGHRRSLVHRILGRDLEPRHRRRTGGAGHPPAVLAARAAPRSCGREGVHDRHSAKRSPISSFAGAADLIAEGDYVVGRWVGGGTHTGPAFSDFLHGALPAASGRKMRFTGTTVLRVENGKIAEEIGSGRWGDRADATRPVARGLIDRRGQHRHSWRRRKQRMETGPKRQARSGFIPISPTAFGTKSREPDHATTSQPILHLTRQSSRSLCLVSPTQQQ